MLARYQPWFVTAQCPCELLLEIEMSKECDDLPTIIVAVLSLLLRADGDRDHMNHSDITCEQSMAIVKVLRRCKQELSTSDDNPRPASPATKWEDDPVAWLVDGSLPLDSSEVFLTHDKALAAFNDWGKRITPLFFRPAGYLAARRAVADVDVPFPATPATVGGDHG